MRVSDHGIQLLFVICRSQRHLHTGILQAVIYLLQHGIKQSICRIRKIRIMFCQFIYAVRQFIHAIQQFPDTVLNIIFRFFCICQHFQKIGICHLAAIQLEGL